MKKQVIKLSLTLFGVVPKSKTSKTSLKNTVRSFLMNDSKILKKSLKYGIVVSDEARYAFGSILEYFKINTLSGEQLNATFHKSWKIIQDSDRETLWRHQILHYLTTYGTNFTSDYIYIPAEELAVPELNKLSIRVIRGIETTEIIEKCLQMLSSGIALEEQTIDNILALLSALNYKFNTIENIKNKEALVKIITETNIYPKSPVEFLRYLIYLATESTLLIKNEETINAIKAAKKDISLHLDKFGLKKCATIFNRFKPLWLSFKTNVKNRPLINEIARLSKKYHQPMPVDVLNTVTSIIYGKNEIVAALAKVNNFRKIRLLNALNTRLSSTDTFLYRIRNGKSFVRKKSIGKMKDYYKAVYDIIYEDLISTLSVNGVAIKYPDHIDYALPASEKMFIGNFPTGTKITAENLVAGVYWENAWGANDLDLSALSLAGKVGWNSAYKAEGLLYSGDITDAPNGATELLYSHSKLASPALSILNIFSGKVGCKFKIIVGTAPEVTGNYMFDPNELILEAESNMVGRQQILGIFLPDRADRLSFILVNAGFGSMSVSGESTQSDNARIALYHQYVKPVSFRKLLINAGAILVENEDNATINLMPNHLQKDTFIKILRGNN